MKVFLYFALFGSLFAQTPQNQTHDPKITGSAAASPHPVKRVPVLLSVTDASGSPVVGLKKEQLTVLDNNQMVPPLDIYSGTDIPLHLGVILLAGHPTFGQQQAAAAALIQKVIRPGKDEAFVISAHGKKPWPGDHLDWKSDPAELIKTVESLDKNVGLNDAFNFDIKSDEVGFDRNAGRNELQEYSGGGVTAFDAAFQMINSDPRPARRVLVIFREPWAHSPGFGLRVNGAVEGTLARIVGIAQALHISVFVMGVEDSMYNGTSDQNIGKIYTSLHAGDDGGGGSGGREYDRQMAREKERSYTAGKTNVERLASETGGAIYWSAKKNYPDSVDALANQINGQYLLLFSPSDTSGPAHALKVTAGNGSRVLTQTVFFFGKAD